MVQGVEKSDAFKSPYLEKEKNLSAIMKWKLLIWYNMSTPETQGENIGTILK